MNRYTYTTESVKQAIAYLKNQEGQPPTFISDHPGSFTSKDGQLFYEKKMVVPEDLRAELLRKILYMEPGGPMGRDSLYYHIQPNFVGIPRSFVLEFLKKQKVLQDVQPLPRSEIKLRGGIRHRKLGVLETDLVHLRAKDALFWLKEGSPDRYFVVVCCVMTGFIQVRLSTSKDPLDMISHFKKMFPLFEKYFPIRVLRSDRGGEFRNSQVADWLKEQGIKQKFVALASMVENRNRLFQKAFFVAARSRKGKLFEAIDSAVTTVNRTLNRKVGLAPYQAIQKTSKELRSLRSQKRKTKPGVKKGPIKFAEGAQVRKLKKARKELGIGYKSYKGLTWSQDVYTVTETAKQGSAFKYKLNTGEWRWADELLGVRSHDAASKELHDQREFVQDDTYFGKDDEEYVPSEEEEEPQKPRKKPKKKPRKKPKKPSKPSKKPSKKPKKVQPSTQVKPSQTTGRRSGRLRP